MAVKLLSGDWLERRRVLPAYTPAQVAAWLRQPPATVRAWAQGQPYTSKGKRKLFRPVVVAAQSATGGSGPLALSFVNLVEIHVLGALRRIHGISLHRIRQSIEYLRKKYPHVKHPLADLDLLTDGLDVWLEEGVLVSVSSSGQTGIRDVLQAHLRRVDRGEGGMAVRLYPFTRAHDPLLAEAPRSIVVDPEVAFGHPVVAGSGVPTRMIASRFDAGESRDSIAADYELPATEIEEAIRWERRAA